MSHPQNAPTRSQGKGGNRPAGASPTLAILTVDTAAANTAMRENLAKLVKRGKELRALHFSVWSIRRLPDFADLASNQPTKLSATGDRN